MSSSSSQSSPTLLPPFTTASSFSQSFYQERKERKKDNADHQENLVSSSSSSSPLPSSSLVVTPSESSRLSSSEIHRLSPSSAPTSSLPHPLSAQKDTFSSSFSSTLLSTSHKKTSLSLASSSSSSCSYQNPSSLSSSSSLSTSLHFSKKHRHEKSKKSAIQSLVFTEELSQQLFLLLRCKKGNTVRRYLKELSPAVYIHLRDGGGHTLLHWAALCGEVEVVKILLQNGADPDARSPGTRQTPLMWSIIRDNVLCMHAILQALSSYQEKESSRYQHMECSRTSHGETAEDDDGRGERMKAAYLSSFPSSSSSFSSLSPHPSLKEVSISTGDKKDVRVKKRITSPLCNKVIEEGIETQAKEEEELSSFFVEKNKKKQTESSLEKEEEDHRRGEEGEREKLIDRFSSSSSSRRFVKDEELTNERRWKDTREEEEKKRGKEEPQDQREREIEKSPSSHSSTRDRGLFARDSKSATCMILAAQHNARKAFLFIYKKLGKISLTETDENGCTPAHWAAFKGNVEILRLLNYFDSDFTTVDIYGYLALHRAVEARHLDACRVLIEECGVMKNERTAKSNITAIEMARALRPPHPELVDYLQNPLTVSRRSALLSKPYPLHSPESPSLDISRRRRSEEDEEEEEEEIVRSVCCRIFTGGWNRGDRRSGKKKKNSQTPFLLALCGFLLMVYTARIFFLDHLRDFFLFSDFDLFPSSSPCTSSSSSSLHSLELSSFSSSYRKSKGSTGFKALGRLSILSPFSSLQSSSSSPCHLLLANENREKTDEKDHETAKPDQERNERVDGDYEEKEKKGGGGKEDDGSTSSPFGFFVVLIRSSWRFLSHAFFLYLPSPFHLGYLILLCICLDLFLFLSLVFSNPGRVRRRKKGYTAVEEIMDILNDPSASMEVVESIDMNRLCRTCWLYRSKRTKHCSICDVCIDGFDHHCMWLDNCIGIFNSRIFTVWILFHAITQLSHFFCCLLILFFLKTEEPRDFSDPAVVILPSSSSSFLFSSLIGERFLLVSLISLHVFTLYHLAALVYRQLRNIARNVTSDEVLNGSRYSTGNEKEVEMCTRTSLLKGSEKGGERKRRSFSHLPSFHREGGRRKDLWSLNQSFAGKAMIWRNCKSFWCDRRPRAILSDGSVSQALIELKDPQRHLLLPSTSSSSFVSSLADLEKKKKKMTEKEKKTKRKKHFSVAYICMLMLSPVTSCVSFMKSFFFSSSFSSSSHLPSSSSSSLGRREKKCGKEVVIMMYRSLKRSCLSSSFCVRSLSFISSFFHSSPKLSRFFRRISRHLRSSSSFSSSPLSQDSKSTSSSSLSSTDLLLFASSSSSPSSSSSSSFFSLLKTCPCRRHRKDSLSSSSSLPFNVQRQQEQETYALNEVKKTACKQTLPKSVEVYSSSSFSSSSPSSFHEDGFRDDCIEEQE